MATVFTRSMGVALSGAPDTPTVFFTAGPGVAWVIRDLVVANYAGAAAHIYVGLVTGGLAYSIFQIPDLAPATSAHLDLRQALVEGDEIFMQSSGPAGTATAVMTGYQFVT